MADTTETPAPSLLLHPSLPSLGLCSLFAIASFFFPIIELNIARNSFLDARYYLADLPDIARITNSPYPATAASIAFLVSCIIALVTPSITGNKQVIKAINLATVIIGISSTLLTALLLAKFKNFSLFPVSYSIGAGAICLGLATYFSVITALTSRNRKLNIIGTASPLIISMVAIPVSALIFLFANIEIFTPETETYATSSSSEYPTVLDALNALQGE